MNELNRDLPMRADHATPPPPPIGPNGPFVVRRADGSKPPGPSAYPVPKSTPTLQFAALFLVPVMPASLSKLGVLLEEISKQTIDAMGGTPAAESILPLHSLRGVHYARLVVIEKWAGLGPMLAFATDYDGPEGDASCSEARAFKLHLDELLKLESGLAQVFQHCAGFRSGQLRSYLARHRVRSSTAYAGASGRSRDQILWEADLRRRVDELVASNGGHLADAATLRKAVRKQLEAEGWTLPAFPAQPDLNSVLRRKLAARVVLVFGAIGACAWFLQTRFDISAWLTVACFALTTVAAVARFRRLEKTDPQFQPKLSKATHDRLRIAAAHENEFLQNQLTHLVAIKPGPLRWLLIRAVFHVLQLFATYRYNQGTLGGIPSIHFARWAIIAGRGVLFFSNFDNSWQSYLGDFINKASAGLTAVWSNTVGYPRSEWLLKSGAQDASRFLAWTREFQLPTQVWYCAYPQLSILNVNDNTEIHRGLAAEQAERRNAPADPENVEARTWQLRVTGVDRVAADKQFSEGQPVEPPVPLDRVQGLIVRGYGHMPETRYLMLRVRSAQRDQLAWIGALPLTSAEAGSRSMEPPEPLINVAFTCDGLRALGVSEDLCQRFSTAFVRGAHDDYRARINGDVGANAPAHWSWGASQNPVHMVLLVFAKTPETADKFANKYAAEADAHGLEVVKTLEGTSLPGRKEHFGFRDGIGQPQIQGCGGTDQEEDAVAAGEFLLGRRDGYGNRADAPESSNGFSFGHNGSYLVFRQLEQDVGAFWRYCAEVGGSAQNAITVAAKMIGRWPSGASLVRHPDKDPVESRFEDEDNFTYLANDEDNDRFGERCPFSAHIRRSNPRDWNLDESREESLKIANRHRIMRRGRPYGAPLDEQMLAPSLIDKALSESSGGDNPTSRGLQFLCFNANIERQFEFIQQHWCNNPHFAGADDGPDRVLGIKPQFVRMVGGAYFFMPSIPAVKLLGDGVLNRAPAPELESPPPDEQVSVDNLIRTLRAKTSREYKGRTMLRGAHPKMHGCVAAKFHVGDDVPADLKVGLFANPGSYGTWIRFSNESGTVGPDSDAGIRGVALKLMDVPGAKLLDGEEYCSTHDFVLISTDKFVTKDAAQFAALIRAVAVGYPLNVATVGLFMLRHPRAYLNLKRAAKTFSNVLDITYFSATPYLLGTRAVKYMLRPNAPAVSDIPSARDADYDYLADRLHQRLASGVVSFDFMIQVQSDPRAMPVEDPGIRWDPKRAPFRKVATLELSQQVVNTPERREFGENLSFNPWRCLPEHRPLGGVNRARRQVYRGLTRFRHARNDELLREPATKT